jgi:tetratricopeptide (TPR) repeat protein
MANAYYELKSPEKAIEFFEKALEVDDSIADVHFNLGNCYYLLNDN